MKIFQWHLLLFPFPSIFPVNISFVHQFPLVFITFVINKVISFLYYPTLVFLHTLFSGGPRNVISGGQELKQEEGTSAQVQPKGANIGMGFGALGGPQKLWSSTWLQVHSPAFLTLLFTLNIS